MELEILKNFVNKNVEVLVGGVWLEGHMTPIVKSVVTLMPIGAAAVFYGPAAVKAENILAIRHVKTQEQPIPVATIPEVKPDSDVRSSLDQVLPSQRFKRK